MPIFNGGHVANDPMAFRTHGLRIQRGPTYPVHANPSRPLVALMASHNAQWLATKKTLLASAVFHFVSVFVSPDHAPDLLGC